MFEDLKGQLQALEASITAAFSDVESRLSALETSVASVDAPIRGAFDRAAASIGKVKSTASVTLGDLRGQIHDLLD